MSCPGFAWKTNKTSPSFTRCNSTWSTHPVSVPRYVLTRNRRPHAFHLHGITWSKALDVLSPLRLCVSIPSVSSLNYQAPFRLLFCSVSSGAYRIITDHIGICLYMSIYLLYSMNLYGRSLPQNDKAMWLQSYNMRQHTMYLYTNRRK
jgi:hypothetical protein